MFLNAFALHPFLFIFKIGFLVVVAMFILYLLIVIKQIHAMNKVITQEQLFPYLDYFSYGLLIITIALFVVAVAIL